MILSRQDHLLLLSVLLPSQLLFYDPIRDLLDTFRTRILFRLFFCLVLDLLVRTSLSLQRLCLIHQLFSHPQLVVPKQLCLLTHAWQSMNAQKVQPSVDDLIICIVELDCSRVGFPPKFSWDFL